MEKSLDRDLFLFVEVVVRSLFIRASKSAELIRKIGDTTSTKPMQATKTHICRVITMKMYLGNKIYLCLCRSAVGAVSKAQ